ncbi:MAG: ABC transporter permease [Bacteroidales bacterium]
MIKNLFKQIWNSKRANGWIFTELLVIFIATWFVIDPLYTTLYQGNAFSLGCDPTNVFTLDISTHRESENGYKEETSQREQIREDFNTLVELVKSCEGITAITPLTTQFIWSGSKSSSSFRNIEDTTKVTDAGVFSYFQGTDFFKVFRFREVTTKRYDLLDSIPYTENGVFITQNAEENLFGKGKGVGKEFTIGWKSKHGNKHYKVLGVLEDFVADPGHQPFPCILFQKRPYLYQGENQNDVADEIGDGVMVVIFRLADGVDKESFFTKFKKEQLPKLSIGSIYVSQINSLDGLYDQALLFDNIPANRMSQIVLALFFMINICLAVFATFWLRIKKRRSEIGLRMAMGSTKYGIRNYLMVESMAIFIIAVFVGAIIIAQIVYFRGFDTLGNLGERFTFSFATGWPINNYVARFVIVTILVALIEGATVLFGTWFSARNAAKILPADALHEE